MCILALIVLFGGCANMNKKNVGSQFIDQKEILETLYQYTYYFDGKKPDKFAELFTENAVWERFSRGTKKPRFSFSSRSELKDFVSNRFKTVLADRQTQLIDQKEILETLYQYTYYFDGKKPDKFAELFTENAVWEIFPRGTKKPRFSFSSRSELKDFVSNRFKTVLADRQTQHYLTNTIFLELKNGFARTQSAVLVVHKIKGEKQPKVINSAIYKDEFVKTKDGWKFSRHTAM